MELKKIVTGIRYTSSGATAIWKSVIKEIVFDSRKAKADTLFVAIKGTAVDGHDYMAAAIEKGVCCIVCEQLPTIIQKDVLYLEVEDSQLVLGHLAANFYEHPSKDLKLVGITGTNGKTTTATLLYRLFMGLGQKAGLLSTVENRIGTEVLNASHTTPDAVAVHALLAKMRDAGCE